jgi:hypothetical protein
VKDPLELVSELSYCDPTTHIFHECRLIHKPYELKILGAYGQRLDACNMKLRFAAESYIELKRLLDELEFGEFIYFDDASRLKATFYLENLLIFLRASLDLTMSAYYIYFTGETKLDSFNDFLKKLKNGIDWLPNTSKEYWKGVYKDYTSENFTWIQALVGREKGMSLRDLVVHKSLIELDTLIDEKDKGRFYIKLTRDSIGCAKPWIDYLYWSVVDTIEIMKRNIVEAEQQKAESGLTNRC